MNDRKGLDATDYIVGYGRPPNERQFAAGKSGNPKGRPKGSRTMGAILQDILNQKIAVTENGKTRRIPTLEVMFRRLVNDAVRRDPVALKLLLPLIDRCTPSLIGFFRLPTNLNGFLPVPIRVIVCDVREWASLNFSLWKGKVLPSEHAGDGPRILVAGTPEFLKVPPQLNSGSSS